LIVEKIRKEILIWMTLLQYFGKSSFHYQAITVKIQKEIKLKYIKDKLKLDRFLCLYTENQYIYIYMNYICV